MSSLPRQLMYNQRWFLPLFIILVASCLSPAVWVQTLNSIEQDRQRALAAQSSYISNLGQLCVIDAQGFLQSSSLPFKAPVDLLDRDHFKVHRSAFSGFLGLSGRQLF